MGSGNKRVFTDCSVHVTRGIESFSAFSEEFGLSPTCLFQVFPPNIHPPDHVNTSGRDLQLQEGAHSTE